MTRLESGVRSQKRSLVLWVNRELVRKAARERRQQQVEQVALFFWEEAKEQAPSDPGLRRAILKALDQLTPEDREVILLLADGGNGVELSGLREISQETARKQISRARQTFLPLIEKSWSRSPRE